MNPSTSFASFNSKPKYAASNLSFELKKQKDECS